MSDLKNLSRTDHKTQPKALEGKTPTSFLPVSAAHTVLADLRLIYMASMAGTVQTLQQLSGNVKFWEDKGLGAKLEEKAIRAMAQVRTVVPAASVAEVAVFGDLAHLLPEGEGMEESDDVDGLGKDVTHSHFKRQHHELRSLPATSGSLSDSDAERLARTLTEDLKSRILQVKKSCTHHHFLAPVIFL